MNQLSIINRQSSIVLLLILLFTLYFSWYTIRRYETLNAYTADLSLIDQAMWNTLHGRFLEATWGDQQQPRLAEHFEPILVPVAALFWLWDDVRALLIFQSFALAMGALPIFWLARSVLARELGWLPLIFPLLYLLSPPLQAAAVADFHADPLMVAPFLFAFWSATQRSWGWMWFWAVVVMMTKETMPTSVVMLGGYLAISYWLLVIREGWSAASSQRSAGWHGVGLIVVGVAWFLVATFGIVAPLAEQHFGSDGPIYLTNRFSTNPLDWPPLLRDPARLRYLGGLVATTGGLALLAPHYLLLGLPIFIANTFSNFPGQYSGEQHYSAPLVAVLMIATIYGVKNLLYTRLYALRTKPSVVRSAYYVVLLLAFAIAFIYHTRLGWTPFARRTETYSVTTHVRLLPDLLARIPASAIISASAAVHPHLAHRPIAYTFPTVEDAAYIMVDVTDVPGVHPNDVKSRLGGYLNSGEWRVLAATDGFLLLHREAVTSKQTLPNSFYDFARWQVDTPLQVALDLTFGHQVRLLGFDLLDEPFHQQTRIRFYWQNLGDTRPEEMTLWPQFFDDLGQPLSDPLLQPAIETVWYSPDQWRKNEVIVTETLPQKLGGKFHLAVAVVQGQDFTNQQNRLPINGKALTYEGATWSHIASFERAGWDLKVLPPMVMFQTMEPIEAAFQDAIHLTGLSLPATHPSDQPLPIRLTWQAGSPPTKDYTVFIHLIDEAGNIIAQNDAQPFWLTPLPSSRWQPGQVIPDAHPIAPPLPPGRYQVRLGLYDWQTFERLPLLNGEDTATVGEIQILQPR